MINSWEEFLKETGQNEIDLLPDVSKLSEKKARRTIARTKLEYMTEHINPKGYEPNWNDWDEDKWMPIFYMGGSGGFRFDGSYYFIDLAYAGTGSAFCFKTKAKSDHAGKKWVELYKDAMS